MQKKERTKKMSVVLVRNSEKRWRRDERRGGEGRKREGEGKERRTESTAKSSH